MKILVPVKRVVDYRVKIQVKSDGSGVELDNVKMSINPFDEIAVEEAVRLKEKGVAQEIVVISIGNKKCEEVIRHAMALGADRGILLETENQLEPLAVAKVLENVVRGGDFTIVLMGKQAIDDDYNQTGQILAGLLERSQATFASKIEVVEKSVNVTREIDGGLEILNLKLPSVITTDLRLNEPRYPSMPNIMQAKQKELKPFPIDKDIDIAPRLKTLEISEPPERKSGIKINNINELIDKLHNEDKVL